MLPTPGPVELIIILVIALIILGPGRLPDVGSALGKSIREFRKASTDIQDSVKVDISTSPSTTTSATSSQTVAPAGPAAPVVPVAPVAPSPAPDAAAADDGLDVPIPAPAVAPRAADLPGFPTVATLEPDGTSSEPSTADR